MSLCLAFISSASEYDFIASYDFSASFSADEFGGYSIKEVNVSNENETYSLKMFVIESYGSSVPNFATAYVIQPHAFKKFVDVFVGTNGDCTYEKFKIQLYSYHDKIVEVFGYLNWDVFFTDWMMGTGENSDYTSFLTESYFNELYFYNDELTYSEGYAQGIQSFKESDIYKETLALEREIGQAEGKDNYLSSKEYKTALKDEYNNGYDYAKRESEQEKQTFVAFPIISVCGIALLSFGVLYFFMLRKRRKRR